jgi:hypothetical protein
MSVSKIAVVMKSVPLRWWASLGRRRSPTCSHLLRVRGMPRRYRPPVRHRSPVTGTDRGKECGKATGWPTISAFENKYFNKSDGGGSGIRTHGTLARTTVFETAPFDRSGIPPREKSRRWLGTRAELPPDCHPSGARSYHEPAEPAKAALIASAALPSSLRNRWA